MGRKSLISFDFQKYVEQYTKIIQTTLFLILLIFLTLIQNRPENRLKEEIIVKKYVLNKN